MTAQILAGQVLRYSNDPMRIPWEDAVHVDDTGLLIENGKISAIDSLDKLRIRAPLAEVKKYGSNHLICPGFIDAHAHYPQTRIIASWGKRLIDWLNGYTFPEEMRFEDPGYARNVSEAYLDLLLAHGTTSAASFCTIHATSVDALFESAATRGMAISAGKTCMDRNAPDGLRDTPQSAYDESKSLLNKWHDQGRAQYVITPRFSPTSSPDQLESLGGLWAEYPECLMQTHLSEQVDEIAWVKDLFPDARDYLDTYEQYGLLGARGLYGHAIHLEPREISRLEEVGASLVHCPTSNTFIGSGLFDMGLSRRISVGLATDTGGGSSFSMLRTMAAAYEVAQLRHIALHPSQLLWLATQGSARALHRDTEIGALEVGMCADITVLDLVSTQAIAQRHSRAEHIWDAVFPTLMMGDDRAVTQVWVSGVEVNPDKRFQT